MNKWRIFFIMIMIVTICQVAPIPVRAAAGLELYGTFESMGVIVTLGVGDDPNSNATAQVEYRVSGSGAYQPGFPLSRVAAGRFVGNLFWLAPGTTYDVRVDLTDPDKGPLNGTSLSGSAISRTEITVWLFFAGSGAVETGGTGSADGGTACTSSPKRVPQ